MMKRIDEFLDWVTKEVPPHVVLIPCFLLIMGCAIHLNEPTAKETEPATEAIVVETETIAAESVAHTLGISHQEVRAEISPSSVETIAEQIPTGISFYQTRDSLWEISVDGSTGEYKVYCYERGSTNIDSRFQDTTVWVKDDSDTLVNTEGTVALAFEDFGDQLYVLDMEHGNSTHYYRLSDGNSEY